MDPKAAAGNGAPKSRRVTSLPEAVVVPSTSDGTSRSRASPAPASPAPVTPLARLERYTAEERQAFNWSAQELLMARGGQVHQSWREVDQIAADERLALQLAEQDFAGTKGSRDVAQSRKTSLASKAETERLAAELTARDAEERQARLAALAEIAGSDSELAAKLQREERLRQQREDEERALADLKLAQAIERSEAARRTAPPPSEEDILLAKRLHEAELAAARPDASEADLRLARELQAAETARAAAAAQAAALADQDARLARQLHEAERLVAPPPADQDARLARQIQDAERAVAPAPAPMSEAAALADLELAKKLQRMEVRRAYSLGTGLASPGSLPPTPGSLPATRPGSTVVSAGASATGSVTPPSPMRPVSGAAASSGTATPPPPPLRGASTTAMPTAAANVRRASAVPADRPASTTFPIG